MGTRQLEADFDEKVVAKEMIKEIEKQIAENAQYAGRCQWGMLEATDGLCYYPPSEQWDWYSPEEPEPEPEPEPEEPVIEPDSGLDDFIGRDEEETVVQGEIIR